MSTSTIVILLLVGLAAGMLSGLVGVGGGLIIVPALVYFLAFGQKEAQGTSLGILLLPVGILGVWQYYKSGHIDFKVVGMVSAGFIIGAFLGSKLAIKIPDQTLKKAFACMMIVTACKMLLFDKKKPDSVPTSDTKSVQKK